MSETPTAFCPECREAEPDPLTDYVVWCSAHLPSIKGEDDAMVSHDSLIPAATDSAISRAFCALLHGASLANPPDEEGEQDQHDREGEHDHDTVSHLSETIPCARLHRDHAEPE